MKDQRKEFRTTDLSLSVTLTLHGFRHINLKRINMHRFQFIFLLDEVGKEIVRDYWEDRCRVNPRLFYEAQKSLKNRIYNS